MSSEAGEGSSSSALPKKEQMDAQNKAMDLLAQGKRNLICQEVPIAVQQFQDACQILSTQFGEMARECAEAYFSYGSALLDLSRMEQDVLGNALEGVDVDADEEEGPNNTDQFETPENIDGDTPPKEKPMEGTEEGGEEEEEGDEEESGSQEEGEEETGSQEEGQESEDSDAIPNLQLSWEFLDLAKFIYARDSSKDGQLKAADAYLKLGEVSLESEQYEQAISDMESCLEIQKKNLEPCDRAIAETYYQLGLACQMDKQMDKAKESFTSALTGLQNKMEKLQVVVTEKPPKNPSQTVEPAESAQREIKEIMEVLPEIKEKIRETEEESKSMENLRSMAKQAMGSIFSAVADSTSETGFPGPSSSTSPSKSAEPAKTMDISHLIRKKRKPEDEKAEVVDPDKKKAKQESSSGDAGVNGVHGQVTASTSEAMAAT